MSDERDRWISLIKDIRQEHKVSIADAERMALERPEWRRWVDRQIANDIRCRRMAMRHMRERGATSLIEKHGQTLKVR